MNLSEMSQKVKREQIWTLFEVGNTSKRISKFTGVSLATVSNTFKRMKECRSLEQKVEDGRLAEKRKRMAKSLAQQIRWAKGSLSINEMHKKLSINVSQWTIQWASQQLRYEIFPTKTFMLSDKNRLKRIDWAKEHGRKHWRNAIFWDEASFWLHGGRVKCGRKGEKSLATCSDLYVIINWFN